MHEFLHFGVEICSKTLDIVAISFGEMTSGGFRPPLPTLTIIEVSWLDIEQRRSKMPH